MDNLFFSTSGANHSSAYFVPVWTGSEHSYALAKLEGVYRHAFASVSGTVLHLALHQSGSGSTLVVAPWQESAIYESALDIGADDAVHDIAFLGGSGHRVGLLVERGGVFEVHVAGRDLARPLCWTTSFRRSSVEGRAGMSCPPAMNQLVVMHADGRLVQVERFALDAGTGLGVTSAYVHETRELVFERDGHDLNRPRTATFVELRAEPPPTDASDDGLFPDARLRPSVGLPIPVRPRALRATTTGATLSIHELHTEPASEGGARLVEHRLAELDLVTGTFVSGRRRRTSRTLTRADASLDVRTVATVSGACLAYVDASLFPAVDRLVATVKRVLVRLFEPNPAERSYLQKHPMSSLAGAAFAAYALAKAGFSGNDAGDAVRHATWAALMTKWLGPETAREMLANHEHGRPYEAMDFHNNEIGVFIGQHWETMQYASVEDAVQDFLAKGYLAHDRNAHAQAKAKWDAYRSPHTRTQPRSSSGHDPFPNAHGAPPPVFQPPPQQPHGEPRGSEQHPPPPIINGGGGHG